jgi:hypothetical protein
VGIEKRCAQSHDLSFPYRPCHFVTKKKGGKPLANDLPPLCPFDLRDREPATGRRRTPSVGPQRGGPLSRAHQVLPLFCLSVSGRFAPSADPKTGDAHLFLTYFSRSL